MGGVFRCPSGPSCYLVVVHNPQAPNWSIAWMRSIMYVCMYIYLDQRHRIQFTRSYCGELEIYHRRRSGRRRLQASARYAWAARRSSVESLCRTSQIARGLQHEWIVYFNALLCTLMNCLCYLLCFNMYTRLDYYGTMNILNAASWTYDC